MFQTQTLELVPGARWTFPVDTEAALAHTQESCYRRISGVVLAGVVPDSCKQCVVCSPACGYKQRTAANVAYYKVKGQRFREKQANKVPSQLATCPTCSSYGFKQVAQQEVCCCMFQTVDGSTLYFHPEVLRELFREGRPVLRRSGSAADDADLPTSADIHKHIYMRDSRDVLRCFEGMSWTFDVACIVSKTTPVDASGPAAAHGAPPLPTGASEVTRRCYVYRVVDRQPCDSVRGPLLSADATLNLMAHVPEPVLEPLCAEEVPPEHTSPHRGSSVAAAAFSVPAPRREPASESGSSGESGSGAPSVRT